VVNHLANGSFEDDDANLVGAPDDWRTKNILIGSEGTDCSTAAADGACSVRLVADSKGAKLIQDVAITGGAGDIFVLDFSTMSQRFGSSGNMLVRMIVYQQKGKVQGKLRLDTTDHAWTDRALSVTTTGKYTRIRVMLKVGRAQQGIAWFDQLLLRRD
jgi:hypothetical protein